MVVGLVVTCCSIAFSLSNSYNVLTGSIQGRVQKKGSWYIMTENVQKIGFAGDIQSEDFAKQISNSKRAKRQLINYLLSPNSQSAENYNSLFYVRSKNDSKIVCLAFFRRPLFCYPDCCPVILQLTYWHYINFYASYPQGDELKDSHIEVASIYGSLDGVANLQKISDSKNLLPSTTTFIEIAGGNHAQFGSYGEQSGDNPAEISADEQIERATNASIDLLNKISK